MIITTRDEAIRLLRSQHSERSQTNPVVWTDTRLEHEAGNGFPVTGPWSYRDTCEHHSEWIEVGEHWLQCRRCWWCKPKLGKPPRLESLPAILKGRVLPPLNGKVDLDKLYMNAGFVIDDGRRSVLSMVRVRVVQYTYQSTPEIRRCGVEVRFKDRGWKEAAVFWETWLHRLIGVLSRAEPKKPKALWRAIQTAMEHRWAPPWEREMWQ